MNKKLTRLLTTGCGVTKDGNKMRKSIIAIAALAISLTASAQKAADPAGYVTYSLPSTTITLEVEAVQEVFHAGPYAKYAEKFLGIVPRMKDETTVQLSKIAVAPYVEADLSKRFCIAAGSTVASNLLKLTAAGLVTMTDAAFVDESVWRFPVDVQSDFSGKGISSNFTSGSAVLYKNDKKESAYNKVAVQQNMVVEKSLEQKAREAASTILDLRKQRLQIVTGDTDATYSGEAMGTAVAELTRLETEYITLFTGYSDYQTQTMKFEVIPQADRANQMYVAFRLSDKMGLLPAEEMNGKPIIMEIDVPQVAQVVTPEQIAEEEAAEKAKAKGKKAPKPKPVKEIPSMYYRIPATCTVKIKEGADLLLQTRIPVYQLGQESSVPLKTALN